MIANHIHDALAQVGKLQKFILERNRFKGYSGKARVMSGAVAIVGALVMSGNAFPEDPNAHLLGWAAVLAAGLAINYSALIYWFLCDSDVRRNPVMLNPALDAIPPLAVGGILAICLIFREEYDMILAPACACTGLRRSRIGAPCRRESTCSDSFTWHAARCFSLAMACQSQTPGQWLWLSRSGKLQAAWS